MEKMTTKRIGELDWLKAICIFLMVAFHLVFIEQKYPEAKQIVYTFHMPVFLVISGFVMNTAKRQQAFLHSLLSLVWPYLIMEAAYIIAASILPINEHIDNLTPLVFIDKLLVHPIGPYWFLHTLAVLTILNQYSVIRCIKNPVIHLLILIAVAFAVSKTDILSFTLALYYILGVALRRLRLEFLEFFQPHHLAPILAILIVVVLTPFGKEDFVGIMFNYMVISSALLLYNYCPNVLRDALLFVGRNTLPVLLFSPLFTLAAKYYQPLLCGFDATGMLFLFVSVLLAVYGSIAIKMLLEKIGIAKWMFLQKRPASIKTAV